MEELFRSGIAVDIALGLLALEALALAILPRLTQGGPRLQTLLPTLLSGACLLMALRGALTGVAWPVLALWLLAALAAHAIDLRQRWSART